MDVFKRFLFSFLGLKSYLRTVSRLFFISYDSGVLKGKPKFACHYFINNILAPGDVVIDLGANLGYYSRNFCRLVGDTGCVYSVEPVGVFREVLESHTRKYKQIRILPFAVGETDGLNVVLGVPASSKYFSHGRTHLLDGQQEELAMRFPAEMRTPDSMFAGLERLDYIKCDIEGYEGVAIPLMDRLLKQFFPILQLELDKDNQRKIFGYMDALGYSAYFLADGQLRRIDTSKPKFQGDIFFVHPSRSTKLAPFIHSSN
ncbi:FkbM family methyltransferase [Mangrovibacterium marinum]|uniref:FkbM family methyltransferase n=1 Tax=Mangrovibacterium marinum TaxID=1639118 RepID=A0A2T5C6A6_9BACT|nr:FkbM family methyltransferase [Mangrovibacterium marinum]PTN10477.1 FkbM family methyltransferase [Mangrovibacterium marinum]